MKQYDSIGQMIKWLIKCRGKRINETAEYLGIKNTTFGEQLKRNKISADTLFKIAAYLDIDLNWMMIVLGYHGTISQFERQLTPRMSQEFREIEQKKVLKTLDEIITENPTSIADARRELLRLYDNKKFYLLDVLVPEEKSIYMTLERDKQNFWVEYELNVNKSTRVSSRMTRNRTKGLLSIKEAVEIVIEERKEQI